jgi:hypothetical protein
MRPTDRFAARDLLRQPVLEITLVDDEMELVGV